MQKHIPTVLVVENQKSLLKVWDEVFKKEGLNVLTAPDGPSALNAAFRWRPDLLIVDLIMSLGLIKKLRENKWGQKVPVMFLSGWLDSESSEEAQTAAAEQSRDFYFHDNWNFDQIVDEVKNKLRLRDLDITSSG
jgi:two-component system OmpR family response regulator